ncbi:hypothetical protein QYM36_007519 [Artemia franciscana]|uniref:RING-type domain-containing protein n=1 Tax=Artemia franciscana TaxID=6661 RepID=A0AA88IMW8_ARTSF|nr:hypothetical protein QYM36_007519 [Artemia franciscana]KAK2726707.1 hypothetical protein QYM36_007519 [Artemia franciscana]
MGINIDRFVGDVDSNFICSICNDVLEDPLQAPMCEHAFCKLCISQWLNTNHSCPLDRERLTIGDLRPVSRILRSFISRLALTCNNQIHGCPAIVALEELETHLLECSFDPKRLVSCSSGCGITICFGERANHNCARSLRLEMKETLERVEKANEDKMSKILGINANLVQKLERVEKANKDKMSKILGINANLVKKLERVEKENEDKMSKILGINANLVQKLERVEKANDDILKIETVLVKLDTESATLKQVNTNFEK